MTANGFEVQIIGADDWKKNFSEAAHRMAFEKIKPAHWDRIDFALLLVDVAQNTPAAYITCREFDHETIYWQFGGATPLIRGTGRSGDAMDAVLAWMKLAYKRVTFMVENDNFHMLALAMKRQFKVIGVRNFHGCVLLEHMLEFKEGE